jgi:hypothetical protein
MNNKPPLAWKIFKKACIIYHDDFFCLFNRIRRVGGNGSEFKIKKLFYELENLGEKNCVHSDQVNIYKK